MADNPFWKSLLWSRKTFNIDSLLVCNFV